MLLSSVVLFLAFIATGAFDHDEIKSLNDIQTTLLIRVFNWFKDLSHLYLARGRTKYSQQDLLIFQIGITYFGRGKR